MYLTLTSTVAPKVNLSATANVARTTFWLELALKVSQILGWTQFATAILGGVMTDRWGRKITLYVFIGTSVFFSALLIFANTWQILAVIYGIIGFLRGGYYASSMAMLMDVTNPKIGATQFSILTSLGNVGELGGGMAGGTLIALLGFSRIFLYSAWAFGPALLILHFIKLKKRVRKP